MRILYFLSGIPSSLLISIAVFCNVTAQISMKASSLKMNLWALKSEGYFLLSLCLYGASFLLTAKVLERVELSLAGPLMAGMTFGLVFICGILIFRETMAIEKMVGAVFIIIGVILISKGGNL